MEFSCHTWAFNDLTLPEAFGTIARLGFRYVDLGSGPHLNMARAARSSTRQAVIDEIKNDLKMFNLKLADLYLMLPRISVNDEEKRTADLTLFKAMVPFAKEIGAPGITISPGLVHPEDDEEAMDRTVAALREMYSAAKQVDIPLSIEPHMDSMAAKPEQALKLITEVPGLKLTVDWAHMVCQDIFHNDILKLLHHARHVQLRQAARAQLQVPFKRGRIKIPQVIQALRDVEYQGVVGIEYMKTVGWHGMVEVDSIVETSTMRDALRAARDGVAEAVD